MKSFLSDADKLKKIMLTFLEKKGKKTGRAEKHACMKAEFNIREQKRVPRAQEKSDAENDPEDKAILFG